VFLEKESAMLYDPNDDFEELSDGSKKRRIAVRAFEDTRASCQQLLTNLMKHKYAGPFNIPVDPVALALPDYFDKITEPMDLGSVQKKLDLNEYEESDEFARDVRLVFSNCRSYNLAQSPIVTMCNSLSNFFEKEFKTIKAQEIKIVDNHELGEMRNIIEELRTEHQKLLGELQKLIKETNKGSPSFGSAQDSPPHLKLAKSKHSKHSKPKIKKEPVKRLLPFDLQQKELLSTKINSLSQENLQDMVLHFKNELSDSQKDNGELEIDLELLSDNTLRRIDDFVNDRLKQQTAATSGTHLSPKKENLTAIENEVNSAVGEAESDSDSSSSSSDSDSEVEGQSNGTSQL